MYCIHLRNAWPLFKMSFEHFECLFVFQRDVFGLNKRPEQLLTVNNCCVTKTQVKLYFTVILCEHLFFYPSSVNV